MEAGHLRGEERTGLAVALGLHGLIVAALLLQPSTRETLPEPTRMTVSLAEDVGMEAEAPVPVNDSRAATAPTLSDTPAPAPLERPQPQPAVARVQPPIPAPTKAPRTPPKRTDTAKPDSKPATQKGGGSRLGDNFLEGQGSSTTTNETRVPASKIGASAKASLVQAISRRIKPRWTPPSGPEVEQIVTVVRFRLKPDGSLSGRPEVVRQTGVNDTNRAQAGRHAEQAIRAVQLAAPFDDLPPEYYEAWKYISAFSFDWRLAQ